MDIKLAFLNGNLEEVDIEQPYGFQIGEKSNFMCKLKKHFMV